MDHEHDNDSSKEGDETTRQDELKIMTELGHRMILSPGYRSKFLAIINR